MYPNFSEEKKLWKRGYEFVAGLDEAGRGPLAGSVVASAFIVRQNASRLFKKIKINDSKKLSESQREYFYEILTSHEDVHWGVGIVSEKVIDKINILEATKLAMLKAIENLGLKQRDVGRPAGRPTSVPPDFLLIDGNFKVNSKIPQKAIIKGDSRVFSIAAASIIAKVTRDRLMQAMHKKYPQYGFERHKGYGTRVHIKNLEKFGICKIHRKSFYPVSNFA